MCEKIVYVDEFYMVNWEKNFFTTTQAKEKVILRQALSISKKQDAQNPTRAI
jgi:hypothetical protein